jgi:hypothetical protein
MNELPYPQTQSQIAEMLSKIDNRLLQCSERFIRQQVRRPIESMLAMKEKYGSDKAEAEWLDIYSIYCANQQLSEACNKLWTTVEFANVTSKHVWKKSYMPIGELFSCTFSLGTLIPTLYYAEISSIISILSSFGCVPVVVNGIPFYILRTQNGWIMVNRSEYVKNVLDINARSWHDRILGTYEGFVAKGVKLPNIPLSKVKTLKHLRNEMHYQILGDLRMWRMFKSTQAYQKHLPTAIQIVRVAISNLAKIKRLTTGCEKRLESLIENLSSAEWLSAESHKMIL